MMQPKSLCSSDNLSTWHVTISKNTVILKSWLNVNCLSSGGRKKLIFRAIASTSIRSCGTTNATFSWVISVIKRCSIQFRDVAQMQRCCRLSLFLNWKRGLKRGLSLRLSIAVATPTLFVAWWTIRALFLTVLLRMKKSSTERSVSLLNMTGFMGWHASASR